VIEGISAGVEVGLGSGVAAAATGACGSAVEGSGVRVGVEVMGGDLKSNAGSGVDAQLLSSSTIRSMMNSPGFTGTQESPSAVFSIINVLV
jgi:hypothetical protein